MRTIIIWQSSFGPVLIDRNSNKRIDNCKWMDIGTIEYGQPVEGTIFLVPGGAEQVLVEFAPFLVDESLPRDFALPNDDIHGDAS